MRRRAQGFTLIEIMVVIAIIAGLVATVAVIVPQMQERQKRLTCQHNLSELGKLWLADSLERPGKPKYEGAALWLYYRKTFKIREGDEGVLFCPGDGGTRVPETPEERKQFNTVDLANPPRDMCSYASRNFTDFPIPAESPSREIIGCDRQGPDQKTMHHRGGLNIVFDSGACDFYDRAELGISEEAPTIPIGPDSDQEWLKKTIYIKQKTE